MSDVEYNLGTLELEVLKTLWEHGPGNVREVMNRLHTGGRNPAYTTVQTLLTRLEQKRFVTSDKSELAYVYRPSVARDKVTRSKLKSVVKQLFDGAAGPLVLQLIRTEKFSSDEIAELHKLIDRLDSKRTRR